MTKMLVGGLDVAFGYLASKGLEKETKDSKWQYNHGINNVNHVNNHVTKQGIVCFVTQIAADQNLRQF